MSLREYDRKRRFDATPEPAADSRARKRGKAPIFVVQLHHARARHYDFRLEVDGALKSWAVPKGPSLRAGEKRLAVQVEDHPLAYATFEGDIPAGQYGAGHVDIFDHGTWRPEQDPLPAIAAGQLDFQLDGERLHGRFSLVRTSMRGRQPQWLLIKRSDAHVRDSDADMLWDQRTQPAVAAPAKFPKRAAANGQATGKTAAADAVPPPKGRKPGATPARAQQDADMDWGVSAAALPGAAVAPMPQDIEPQLATLRSQPPKSGGWLSEIKWDGYRLLAYRDSDVQLRSRNQLPWAQRLPELVQALRELPVRNVVLDGELVAIGNNGASDFGLLQAALERHDTADLRLVCFDLLYLDGIDLRATPLLQRRQLLSALLASSGSAVLAFSEHIDADPAAAFAASAGAGLEGIICKQIDAPYRSGRQSSWIKLKHSSDESFLVVGYTAPKASRQGFGSLLLAQKQGRALEYVGRVGSGFDDRSLRNLTATLRTLHSDQPAVELPAHVPFKANSVHWVQPRLVVDVHTRGRGKEGLVRQASFLRVREDRSSADLQPAARKSARPANARGSSRPRTPALAITQANTRGRPSMSEVTITHPERVVYPDTGITKQDVADYYAAVADYLLPELANRPLSLLRCPDGVASSCFFQKHWRDSPGSGVHPVALREKDGHQEDYVYIDSVQGVLELVQMGTIEFHPWGALVDDPDHADRLVFDLDPGDGISWEQTRNAAFDVRDRLAEVGLESWARLSGGKGVHVCVPVAPTPWPQAKAFCEAFAKAMSQQSPMDYVATASKQQRKGRIFIDWLRNSRGATSVAGWVLRAREGAPVAMPLRWQELAKATSAAEYDLRRAKRRAGSLRSDPWEGFAQTRQELPMP